jgi:hypothetical protein
MAGVRSWAWPRARPRPRCFGPGSFRSLADRGLRGVKLVIADDHKGLRAAARRVFNAGLQRCRVGLLKNPRCGGGRFEAGLASVSDAVGFESGCSRQPRRPGSRAPRPKGEKEPEKSGGEPLQVDRGGGQERLDAHVLEPAAHGASQPVPSLGLPWNPSERQRWR